MATTNHPHRPHARTLIRVAADFVLGVAVFALLIGLLDTGHSQAYAGAAGWVTKVSPAHESGLAGFLASYWNWMNRDGLHILLTVTFGVITAVNLAVARHLRHVSVS